MTENHTKVLPVDTSRLQLELSQRFLSNSTFESLYRSNNLSTYGENPSEMMSRRLKSHRHPLSGISSLLPEMLTNPGLEPDQIFKEIKNSHKLNNRILETWLNNTISDALEIDVPKEVITQDAKVPLIRFGIDRSTLLNSGLQSSEVDRIYRSLFVYSIGFFQLTRKVLEHCKNKYTIITGIWKAYAILLEYCCQFDYELIVTTLKLEKNEELERVENEYKEQIYKMEERQRQMLDNYNLSRQQLQQMQKDLMDEVRKREELEDELLQRGSGHEEEVTMRLQFESKLNQMYAKLRDMESKITLVNETLVEMQKTLEERTDGLQKERKKNLMLIQHRVETEQDMKRIIEREKQVESTNSILDQRLIECYAKIEELSQGLSNANTQHNQSLNDLAHKKIEIEDLKFTIEIFKGQAEKLSAIVEENKEEKNVHVIRIASLEYTLNEETAKHKHFQQEYVKIKEGDIVKTTDLEKYRKRSQEQEILLQQLEKERDTLKIHKESIEATMKNYKLQFKQLQEKLEDMNKGRRIVEELNESLKSRIEDRDKEIKDLRQQIIKSKEEQEKYKNAEIELQASLAAVNVKLHSIEKQFEATRLTLQDKIDNLNEILESEKNVRQNWIYRYEEEQKILSNVTRELISTQDRLNESTIKNNNLSASLEENNQQMEKTIEKHRLELEENLALRAANEDLTRKIRTSQILLERVDEDYRERMVEFDKKNHRVREGINERVNQALMENEDTWVVARKNAMDYNELLKEHQRILEIQAGIDEVISEIRLELQGWAQLAEQRGFLLEESRVFIISQYNEIRSLKNEVKNGEFEVRRVKKEFGDFRNLAPADVRNAPDPFRVLIRQIAQLKGEISHIENSRPKVYDRETQFDQPKVITFDMDVQVELISSQEDRKSHHSSTSSMIDVPLESLMKPESFMKAENLANKKLNGSQVKNPDNARKNMRQPTYQEEDFSTPMNMKSIYNTDPEVNEFSVNTPGRLPAIIRKGNQPSSLVTLPQPIPNAGDFKRFLKQAVSRRKHEKSN